MLSRTRTRRTDRGGPIPANAHETSIGAIVFAFLLTISLPGAASKCFATTSGTDDGAAASAEARSEAVAPPAISLGEAGAAPESAAIRFAPAIPDPPSILDRDHKTLRPGLPRPCFLPPQNFCRALKNRRVVLLGGMQTAALISDGISTRQFLSHGYSEVDPVAKIFIGSKPTWARMAPMGAVQVMVGMWLGERMATSRHLWVRRFWWLPQTLGIAGNVAATVHNLTLH